MKDNKILALHEKSLNYKDVFILHICRICSRLWLKLYLHCQTISTHDTDYSQYHGYWLPGEARSHDVLKSEYCRSGHQGQYHCSVLILLLWLFVSLVLILSSLNTRTCLSSIVNIMDADGLATQWSILSFQYQEVIVKIQIYHNVFKLNPPVNKNVNFMFALYINYFNRLYL